MLEIRCFVREQWDDAARPSRGRARQHDGRGRYTLDGRCVSLLKILLTNYCIYDCLYCINRASSSVRRDALHRGGSGAAPARFPRRACGGEYPGALEIEFSWQ